MVVASSRKSFPRLGRLAATACLFPIDLLRLTRLFVALTIRFVVQVYLNLLSGLPRQRRPALEFCPCRASGDPRNWGCQKRVVVRVD